jgi:molybdate transport system regulatory protein
MKNLLPADVTSYRLAGRVWLEGPTERFLGIGRLELLLHIRDTGSISKAAAAMSMSYKRAWDLVQSMNSQARQPLVSTQAGGARGGGASLTPAGEEAIQVFEEVQARFQAFLAAETRRLLG